MVVVGFEDKVERVFGCLVVVVVDFTAGRGEGWGFEEAGPGHLGLVGGGVVGIRMMINLLLPFEIVVILQTRTRKWVPSIRHFWHYMYVYES